MRTDLAAAHPLPAPFVLHVEPTNVCNFRCPICPESLPDYAEQAGYYQHMGYLTWVAIKNSLRGWCKVKTIRFYHTGEPLLNQSLHCYIAESREVAERTEVTSNASRLDDRAAHNLIDSGLDHFRVSVYSTSERGYELATGSRYRLSDILGNVQNLRVTRDRLGEVKPFIYAELVTNDATDKKLFAEQWGDTADSIGVKDIHNWGSALVQLGERPRPEKLVCPFPFYELVIKANGDVTVCCVDWANQLLVGNVNETSLRDIWEGPRLAELRGVHLAGRRGDLNACRDCNVLHSVPDNLDSLVRSRVSV